MPTLWLALSLTAQAQEWPPPSTPAAPAPAAGDPWGTSTPPPAEGDPWGSSPAAPAPTPTPAPEPWTTAAPAAPTAPTSVAPPVPTAAPTETAGRETRETWNGDGKLIRRLVFQDGQLQTETSFRYDDQGQIGRAHV